MEDYTTWGAAALDQVTAPGHNNCFPWISQLPTELFTGILQLSLPEFDIELHSAPYSSHFRVKRCYILRSVTKRWQTIIEGTPSFWTTVVSTLPSYVNETSIIRSANLPISIIYYHPGYTNPAHLLTEVEFLKIIQHSRPRWSAISLNLYDSTAMVDYIGTPLPLLRTIIVRSVRPTSLASEPLELLGGDTANLRFVCFSGVSILCSAGHFVQLKCLTLKKVGRDGLRGPQLLDTLRASPALEVLNLKGIRAEVPPPSPTIPLHHLRCIKLRSCAIDLVVYILQQIQAPSCTRLCLGIEDEPEFDVPHFLNETLKPFHGMLYTTHRQLRESTVLLDFGLFRWYTPSCSKMEGFSIFIDCALDPLCISWVDGILQDESGLQISFGRAGAFSEAVLRSVAPMRSVTKVLIRETWLGADNRTLLQFIGKPLPTGASLPSLPYLKEIFLPFGGWKTQDLLEMVRSRFCALPWKDMEQTLLTINVPRGGFSWAGITSPILDLATIVEIRKTSGVQCVKLSGSKDPVGMLAVTWNESCSQPVWV
ncbi:hypothetical protein FRC01_003858 [Tulasnella sp. 417]|nr:hypothetical protein FRC01_003858 [Tulasnella sp. 417]